MEGDSRGHSVGGGYLVNTLEMGENARYYNESRTHLGLGKTSPDGRPVEPVAAGPIRSRPEVGGLHRRYHREAA